MMQKPRMQTEVNPVAQKLLSRCFSQGELQFLHSQSEFSHAVAKIANLDEASAVVELGVRILLAHEKHNSPMPPRHA
jgi:hypothetical protein